MNPITSATSSAAPNLTRFWPAWIVASAVGGALTGLLENYGLQFAATLLLQGVLVGALQWLVLRPVLPRAWCWIVATGVGLIAGYFVWIALSSALSPGITWLAVQSGLWEVFWLNTVQMPIILIVPALLQSLCFRGTSPWAKWLALSLAGGLALGMGGAIAGWLTQADAPGLLGQMWFRALAPMMVGWALYGLVTGWYLARRLRAQPVPAINAPESATPRRINGAPT